MFGLSEQVCGDELRRCAASSAITSTSDGPAGRSSAAPCRIGGDDLLGGSDVGAARPEDLVDLRNALGAVSHCGDRLRAADLEHRVDAAELSGDEHSGICTTARSRRRAQNSTRAAHELRRHGDHDHRRRQRRRACGYVETHGRDRANHSLTAHARHRLDRQRTWQLRFVERANVLDRALDRRDLRARQRLAGRREFFAD